MSDLVELVGQNRFTVCEQKSVCFVPGFFVTYFLLPKNLQSLLINWLKHVEPLLRRWFPANGYTICALTTRGVE